MERDSSGNWRAISRPNLCGWLLHWDAMIRARPSPASPGDLWDLAPPSAFWTTMADSESLPKGVLHIWPLREAGFLGLMVAKPYPDSALFEIARFLEQIILVFRLCRERSAGAGSLSSFAIAENVFLHSGEGILVTDRNAEILDVNPAFSKITGYRREEVLGRNPSMLSAGTQDKAFYRAMWDNLEQKGHWAGEVVNRRKDGAAYAEWLNIHAIRGKCDEVTGYVAHFSDITALKEHHAQLERIANFDVLTGLPNRFLLVDRLKVAMTQTVRRGGRLALAYLDVDGFKAVNDLHGRELGDQFLKMLATRIAGVLRSGDSLARLGGDEFVVVLMDVPESDSSPVLFGRLLNSISETLYVDSFELSVSISMGVTFYPQAEEVDADQLLRQADQAMLQAKHSGKNCYRVFDLEHDRNVRLREKGLGRIRQALKDRELLLHYQPKINMRSGEVVGAEALIRWQNPQSGLLFPASFMPAIEDDALAIEVGEWVLETGLQQIEAWQANGLSIPISINVGARQLQHKGFVPSLRAALSRHRNIRPGDLELEILETSALDDVTLVSSLMNECHQMGIDFALDDFGTGYSSLLYLKRLPARILKIDRSFVRDMLDDPDDLSILEGILGLATAFRRQVIAEGVETLAHGEALLRLGCEFAQGYAISPPQTAEEFLIWLRTWSAPRSWKTVRTLTPDRLPVLFASVDHRAWVSAMTDYLRGTNEIPPESSDHHCRFGRWLDHGGRDLLLLEGFDEAVDDLHRQVHQLAAELVALKQRGLQDTALSRIKDLHELRDRLVAQLSLLY